MRKRRYVILTWLCLGIVAVVVSYFATQSPDKASTTPPVPDELSHHPLYSTYHFPPPGTVIRIGIQPIWVYVSNLMEAMHRDRILKQALFELGLHAEYFSFLKGPDINFFMERNQLDIGMAGYLPTIKLAAQRNILIPATLDHNFFDVVSKRAEMISELEGRRIGFPEGSDAHHALVRALDLMKIDATLVPIDVSHMLEMMQEDQVDAVVSWEPETAHLRLYHPEYNVIFRSRWVSFLYFDGAFAQSHPRVVAFFLLH